VASIIKKLINGILGDVVQLDHSAQDIDDTITKTSQLTGRNLLDNWYFADPINQRGQTSYTGAVYGVDRWRSLTGNTISVEMSGLRITGSNDTSFSNMIQQNIPEELLNALDGKTVTASILVSENTGGGAVAARLGAAAGSAVTTGLSTYTVTFNKSSHSYFSIQCATPKAANFVVQAVKLELGTQQTLARKAVDGTWTLIDPPPNKAEELAKCQRYFYRKKGPGSYSNYGNGYINSANGAFIFVNVPEMRVAPTVAASGNFRLSTPGTAISVTSISSGGASTNGFYRISASAANSLTSNTPVWLQANNDVSTYIDFSADL
jgi:hypothetical protein